MEPWYFVQITASPLPITQSASEFGGNERSGGRAKAETSLVFESKNYEPLMCWVTEGRLLFWSLSPRIALHETSTECFTRCTSCVPYENARYFPQQTEEFRSVWSMIFRARLPKRTRTKNYGNDHHNHHIVGRVWLGSKDPLV